MKRIVLVIALLAVFMFGCGGITQCGAAIGGDVNQQITYSPSWEVVLLGIAGLVFGIIALFAGSNLGGHDGRPRGS